MGDVSRRAVLGASAGAMGLFALGIDESDAGATTAPDLPMRAHYAKSLGRVFSASRAGHTVQIKLIHIHDLSPTTAKQRPHAFILVFAAVDSASLRDGIYVVRRSGVYTHSLFLSSVGSNRGMQAVVNRAA